MMDKFSHLTEAARAAVNPYTKVAEKLRLASLYAMPLQYLHDQPPERISGTIKEVAQNLDLFMSVAEDSDEDTSLRSRLITDPIRQSIEYLAASAYQQNQRIVRGDEIAQISSYFSATHTSIKDHTARIIPFDLLINRLMKIAENPVENKHLREDALNAFASIHNHANRHFGHRIEREPYEERIVTISLTARDPRLTTVAIQIIDTPLRIPNP